MHSIDELLKRVIVMVYQQLSGHIIDQQVLVKRVLWHVLKASQVDELLPVILSFDNTLHKPTEVGLAYARYLIYPYDKRLYLRVMKVLLYILPRPDSKVLLVHVFRLVLWNDVLVFHRFIIFQGQAVLLEFGMGYRCAVEQTEEFFTAELRVQYFHIAVLLAILLNLPHYILQSVH